MKSNVNSDYQIRGIDILLNEDCIGQRFYPLIQYKNLILRNLLDKGCLNKTDCVVLSDEDLIGVGLPDAGMAALSDAFCSFMITKERASRIYPMLNAKIKMKLHL